MKLEFGNPDHIRKRDLAIIEINAVAKLIFCPFCKRQQTIKNVVDWDIDKELVQWAGCANKDCVDNPNHPDYGKGEPWHGWTDFEGRSL